MQPYRHTLDIAHPPALDLSSRAGVASRAAVRELADALPASLPESRRDVARGLLFLWHDHWEEAHAIAQGEEGEADHDLLHAMVHRREGDFSNAGYWFRRAGKPRSHALLAPRAAAALQDSPLAARLLPAGAWNPIAFVEAVRRGDDPRLLRDLQALEFAAFLEDLSR